MEQDENIEGLYLMKFLNVMPPGIKDQGDFFRDQMRHIVLLDMALDVDPIKWKIKAQTAIKRLQEQDPLNLVPKDMIVALSRFDGAIDLVKEGEARKKMAIDKIRENM
jgi:hypothetical protein